MQLLNKIKSVEYKVLYEVRQTVLDVGSLVSEKHVMDVILGSYKQNQNDVVVTSLHSDFVEETQYVLRYLYYQSFQLHICNHNFAGKNLGIYCKNPRLRFDSCTYLTSNKLTLLLTETLRFVRQH